VSLKKAIKQWGNLGAFVSALHTDDYDLLGRSLQDEIVEPIRSILIPYFKELKKTALENGALGFGISGSGPSVFSLCKGQENALRVKEAIHEFYMDKGLNLTFIFQR
jgi:homoserine kinase